MILITRIMNQTTLVIVAVLAASALIMGTSGMLQPAAAHQQKSHEKSNLALALQQIHQDVQCNNNSSNNCNNNYQQAANIAVFDHVSQK
jgi:hypothetical protein